MSLTDYRPRPHQAAVESHIRRNTFIEMHRRAGKTLMNTRLCARQLILPLPDRTVLFVCPYLKQARQVAWPYFQMHLHGVPHIRFKPSENTIINTATKSRIIISGMKDNTADSLRGLGAGFVVADELSGYDNDDFHSVLGPIVAETRGTIVLTGTPPPTFDLFLEQRQLHQQMALEDPDNWAYHSYPVHKTDVFTPLEIEELYRRSPGSAPREYGLDTSSGDETSFVPLSLMEDLIKRDPELADPTEPPVCGWDVSLKRDASAYVIREDHQIIDMGRLTGKPSEQVTALYRAMNRHRCRILAYDQGGLGHAFDEPLERLTDRDVHLEVYNISFNSRASDPSKFSNVRSEMYYRLQSWLHERWTALPSPQHPTMHKHAQTLLQDISAQVIRANDKNLFQMERKEKIRKAIGRSPDFSDALALSHIPVDPADPYDRTYKDFQDTSKMTAAEIMDAHPELYPERWRN